MTGVGWENLQGAWRPSTRIWRVALAHRVGEFSNHRNLHHLLHSLSSSLPCFQARHPPPNRGPARRRPVSRYRSSRRRYPRNPRRSPAAAGYRALHKHHRKLPHVSARTFVRFSHCSFLSFSRVFFCRESHRDGKWFGRVRRNARTRKLCIVVHYYTHLRKEFTFRQVWPNQTKVGLTSFFYWDFLTKLSLTHTAICFKRNWLTNSARLRWSQSLSISFL